MIPLLFPALAALILFAPSIHADDDLSKLEESAASLIEAFNAGDAEAVSNLFVEDGELVLSSGKIVIGKANLLEHYTSVFSDPERSQAALEVGSVRLLTSGMAMEDGTVHLTAPDGGVSSFFYQAVHAKQEDGSWKLASVRDVEGDQSMPAEKLGALKWLIGDWVMQTRGGDTWISFFWSEDGPYIDAKAMSESPQAPATSATMRIGWNEAEEAFKSWGFDGEGGFNESDWVESGPNEFLLKTMGVTASGEKNVVTQVLKLSNKGNVFSWSKRDQVLGGEVLADRTVQAVKRPPKPDSAVVGAE
ncbi:MAG: SgcJ/EcaC family oxidoreductase [Verrucomicrobiales bacterium]|nr:SgcJ/EcaC family oxidoreductase [Verrucomicrobiales bacterium]